MAWKGAAVAVYLSLLALQTLSLQCSAESAAEPDFGTYRVKALKKLLDERGVECAGCVEKEHLVEKLKETYHLPLLSEEEVKQRAESKARAAGQGGEPTEAGEAPKMDQNDFLRIMNELNKDGKGGQNFKMWTPDDLKNFGMDDWDKKVKPPSGSKKGGAKDDL